MKKILKLITALTLVLCLAFSLTACINDDWADVEQKLKEEGYSVTATVEDSGIKTALALRGLTAEADDVDCYMVASKDDKQVFIIFCDERDTAKSLATQIETRKSDYMKLYNLTEDTCDYGRDGKVVYFGHKDAVDAAK